VFVGLGHLPAVWAVQLSLENSLSEGPSMASHLWVKADGCSHCKPLDPDPIDESESETLRRRSGPAISSISPGF